METDLMIRKKKPPLHSGRSMFRMAALELLDSQPLTFEEKITWVRKNIRRRECLLFTPVEKEPTPAGEEGKDDKSDSSTLCQCGNDKRQHLTTKIASSNAPWDKTTHTRPLVTNAFGDVEFLGQGGKTAKYIRVDVDSQMKNMIELMTKVWEMEKPNLLISVTGGAKNFHMSKRLTESFRRGLMKAARSTGAWIITGGTHAGLMKHVGKAVKDYGLTTRNQSPVVAIGIASWGCIQNKDQLIDRSRKGLWPAGYRIEKTQNPKETFLDSNHTHFFLVDNGTQHQFATEIAFRARLESEIASKLRSDSVSREQLTVPIVMLVLEGGTGTLSTVHHALQNNTPTVVVKGSGKMADILAYAYLNSTEEEIVDPGDNSVQRKVRVLGSDQEEELGQMLEKDFGDKDLKGLMAKVKDCLNKWDLLSVYEPETNWDIDVAMLNALLKANKNQAMDQLKLALLWNRLDMAKSELFNDDRQWQAGALEQAMLTAMQLNRVDFVDLFLDHGVDLKSFLTIKRLLTLYNRIPSNCLLRTLLTKIKKKNSSRENFSLVDVGQLIKDLVGSYYHTNYLTEPSYTDIDVDQMMEGEGGEMETPLDKATRRQSDFRYPGQDLFIWSVLMMRRELAKMFWFDGKDALAAALMAYSMLRALRKRTQDTELRLKIQEQADEWNTLAIGLISRYQATDEQNAQDILIQKLDHWGEATCILIAVKSKNKNFISQTACQALLNRIWMGKMSQSHGSLKLLLCAFLPPLAYWLIKFNVEEQPTERPDDFQEPEDETQITPIKTQESSASGFKTGKSGVQTPQSELEETEGEEDKHQAVASRKWQDIRDRMYWFFTAPVVKFIHTVISYLTFLTLYSFILIVQFESHVTVSETVLIIWVCTLVLEEFRQVITGGSHSFRSKIYTYVTDIWNVVDIITIFFFMLAMILRFMPSDDSFEASRVFIALSFVSFFLRLLHIFSVLKELGPKLVMIGRMIKDLIYFLIVLMVFVLSYAIASHSILFPNTPLTGDTVIAIMRRSYWNIYGELMLEEIDGEADCTFDENLWMNGTYPRCPTEVGRYVVPVMLAAYMLLSNVLLLNLLIAMFSYTFQMVQDNTDKHWCYQRYSLINEYYTRPVLAPPLIVLTHVYSLVRYLLRLTCGRCCKPLADTEKDDDFCRRFRHARELVEWENAVADAFHQKSQQAEVSSTDSQVKTIADRLDTLMGRLDELQEQQTQAPSEQRDTSVDVVPSRLLKLIPNINNRLTDVEKNLELTLQSVEWIVQHMQKTDFKIGTPRTLSQGELESDGSDSDELVYDSDQPVSESAEPAGENAKIPSESAERASESAEPAYDSDQPVSENGEPLSESGEPPSESADPASKSEEPGSG